MASAASATKVDAGIRSWTKPLRGSSAGGSMAQSLTGHHDGVL